MIPQAPCVPTLTDRSDLLESEHAHFGQLWCAMMGLLWVRCIKRAPLAASAIGRVQFQILGDLALPALAVRQKLFLVVEQFFAGLGGEFKIRPLDNGIDRTGFLAKT